MAFTSAQNGRRLSWPDVAKGLGIALMYYGHVLACLPAIEADRGSGPALEQMRFIYAFHMPLFFALAGLFFRPSVNPWARWQTLARRRLAPVLFFSAVMMPLWLAGPLRHGAQAWHEVLPLFADYLRGHPSFDWVTWFLVCLFVCECLAAVLLSRVTSASGRFAAGVLSLALGLAACSHAAAAAALTGVEVRSWFFYEALVALGFYGIGLAAWPLLMRLSAHRLLAGTLGAAALVLALATFRANVALGHLTVMMSAARHGDPLLFSVTALAGSMGVIGLAMVVADAPVLAPLLMRIGRNSLPLLGLSGLFFHFLNPKLELAWPPSDSALPLTLYALVLAVVSLAAALPVGEALMRWVPQWLGQPQLAPERADPMRGLASGG
jgi:fucose 4-O-acetylase-like acetyltransferase